MKAGFIFAAFTGILAAQVPNPTQQSVQPQGEQGMPVYRVTVVGRSTNAINYRHRSGATKIDFQGTPLLPRATGEAKVESKKGYIEIEVEFDELQPASRFGPEYLTYVLWAITPEGRANNLGEILLDGNRGKLNVTTELQSFGLIVTAEPYFAVTQPSDAVVVENIVRPDTMGKVEQVNVKYDLLQRGQYTMNVDRASIRPMVMERSVPLELYEARNAVQIAQWAGADRYASDTFRKAQASLQQAEDYQSRKAGKKSVVMTAREAVQTAEDARVITIRRREEERIARERQEAAEREARAKADAEKAEQERRAEAERARRAEEERLAAERVRREAEEAAARASRERAEAETARAAALAQQQAAQAEAERARQAAQEADRLRQKAETDQAQLRQQLQQQLNTVLQTRDTARGLIVNMSDVLFDTARWTLRPGAREKLAKIAGILLAHPGLQLEIEGHTDSVGSDEYNQRLSERRAGSVRDYLVQNGVNMNSVVARGLGETNPVTSNDNAAGRQQNRRVEIVVSGAAIGAQPTMSGSAATPR